MFFFFFFQAEDGIRDKLVTGVQTCALPILLRPALPKTSCEVGKAIADVFQKFKSCLGPLLGFPVMSQLSCSKTTILTASSLVLRHDAGKPVRTTLIPPICQPPSSLSIGADQLPPQRLWRPKGSSYNAEFTQLILASNTEGPWSRRRS